MFKGKIHKRVVSALKSKIADSEQKLDDGYKQIENEHEEALTALREKRESSRVDLENGLVDEIVGKFF